MTRPQLDEDQVFVVAPESIFQERVTRYLVLPLMEDEEGNAVWGYGHWDKAAFAWMVNVYDRVLTGSNDFGEYEVDDVQHFYAYAYKRKDLLDDDYLNWAPVMGEPDLEDPFLFKMTRVSR